MSGDCGGVGTIQTAGAGGTAPCGSGAVCITRGATTTPLCDVNPVAFDVCQNTTYKNLSGCCHQAIHLGLRVMDYTRLFWDCVLG